MPQQNQTDLSGLSFVALRQLQVNGTTRNIGDAVPEAAMWKNIAQYLSAGYIAAVQVQNTHPHVPQDSANQKSKYTKVGKAAGNASFTRYQPHDFNGTPAAPTIDSI